MANYKKSIGVGVKFESKTDVSKKLATLLKSIDKKINIKLNIKQSKTFTDSKKSLSDIAKTIDKINSKMTELNKNKLNIFDKNAINNINKLNEALEKASKLKNNLEKSEPLNNSNTNKKVKDEQEYLELLNQEKKALETLKNTNVSNAFTLDDEGVKHSIDSIIDKIEEVYSLSNKNISLSSFINQLNESNEIINLLMNKIKTLGSQEGLEVTDEKAFKQANEYVNTVKQAYNELLKQIKAQDELNTKLKNMDYTNAQKSAYEQLNTLLEKELDIKNKLIKADKKTSDILNEQLITNKLNQQALKSNIKDNNYTSLKEENNLVQKRIELEEKLRLAKAKNDDSVQSKINKETWAYEKEQKAVKELIENQIKLLEVKKQSLNRQYGDKIDTSSIDEAINKLKKMDNVSMDDLKSELSKVDIKIAELVEHAKSTTGIFSNMVSSLRNIGIYLDIGDVVRVMVNGMKDAVDYIINVENAMIDLRRVVDMSDESAKTFQNNMHNLSLSLASSTAETISAVATFSKLGYSLKEATSLGEVATKYNLAADINDMESATSSLVATLKGFNLEADKATEVTDKINEVSNNYAVTANDLNESLRQSSSSLSTFGNSIDEAIAMNTAIIEITRNANQSGNALNLGA